MFKVFAAFFLIGAVLVCGFGPAWPATTTLKVSAIEAPNMMHRAENVTALRGMAGTAGRQSVYLEGRTTRGDGGEGNFRWESSDLSTKVATDTQNGIYVAPALDLTGASGAWVRQYSGDVNVRWFGFQPDNTAAVNNTALQAAVSVSKKLFIPKGIYNVSDVAALPQQIIIIGETQIGGASSMIQNVTDSDYIFQTTEDYSRTTIRNMAFSGVNILDLRSSGTLPNGAVITNCHFVAKTSGCGIAINAVNHDFSLIQNNNFYNFDGFCAIRCAGWIDYDSVGGFKATTQVDISDNIFHDALIGISIDLVDSIKIRGNDFSGVDNGVDIGGRRYEELKPTSTGNYRRGEEDPTLTTWGGTFYGVGFFTNVTISDENHFEYYDYGVWADGISYEFNTGLKIRGNNFQSPNTAATMIKLEKCVCVNTYGNELNYGTDTTTTGIAYADCVNLRLVLDMFYGTQSGKLNSNDYMASGENYNVLLWKGHNGLARHDAGTNIINHLSVDDLVAKRSISATSPQIGPNFEYSKRINASATRMNQNDTLDLLTLGPGSCGVVYIYVYNSLGSFYTSFAVSKTTVDKLTTDTIPYSLSKSGGKLIYIQTDTKSSVDTYVCGVFVGLESYPEKILNQ